MSKIELQDVQSLTNEQSAINLINNNSQQIELKSNSFLSRDGTSPNSMNANLDMNSYRIINLPSPNSDAEPIRRADIDSVISGDIVFISGNVFNTVADVQNTSILGDVKLISTSGYYNAGDGGGASYKRVLGEPAH